MDPPRHNLGQRVNQPDGRRCNSSPRPRTQSIGSVGPFSRAKLDHFWRAPKNEALVRATEEIQLVEAICRILVEDGGMRMAWVGYREANAAQGIRRVGHAGFDDGYLDLIDVSWADAPTGQGPTGTAIRTGELCWADDIATDPRFRPWQDEALRRGYRSALALPLKSNGTAFGALILYADRPCAFDEQTRSHFTDLANDLAYGVMAIRTRVERARVEAELR